MRGVWEEVRVQEDEQRQRVAGGGTHNDDVDKFWKLGYGCDPSLEAPMVRAPPLRLAVTRLAASLRTANSPQPKEAQPTSLTL